MLRSFGTLSSLRIGAVGHALQALLWALSTSSWHFYALLPFGWLRYLCASSLDVCLTQQADAAGMGKGELRGALGNVSQLVRGCGLGPGTGPGPGRRDPRPLHVCNADILYPSAASAC